MKRVTAVLLATFVISAPANAGDYSLTICNKAFPEIRARSESWPVHSTDEIAAKIEFFASGGMPPGIFHAAFTNGHVAYCSPEERRIVREALLRGLISARSDRVSELADFLMLSGMERSISLIDAALSKGGLTAETRQRLRRARAHIRAAGAR